MTNPFEYRSPMLIQVDNRPIRRSYTARLRRARRAITRLETQIARYHEVDSPAFYLWYHREFGQILSHHRGLREQIMAHEFIQRDPDIEATDPTSGSQEPRTAESSPENDFAASDYFRNTTEADDNFSLEPKEPHRE